MAWITTPSRSVVVAAAGSDEVDGIGVRPCGTPQPGRRSMRGQAPLPIARTAAAIRCSGVIGVPGSRATNGWTCSIVPESIARYQAERDRPEASSVMRPWWPRAQSSKAESLIAPTWARSPAERNPAVLPVVRPGSRDPRREERQASSDVAVEVAAAVGAGGGERAPAARRAGPADGGAALVLQLDDGVDAVERAADGGAQQPLAHVLRLGLGRVEVERRQLARRHAAGEGLEQRVEAEVLAVAGSADRS